MLSCKLSRRLLEIGKRMSAETDVSKILNYIAKEITEITNAGFGTIAVYEEDITGQYLNYKYRQSSTMEVKEYDELRFPIDNQSIIGSSFLNKKAYNFESMDDVFEQTGFHYNRQYDEEAGTFTSNLLVVPMNNFGGECIGVLLLANKRDKEGNYTPFTADELEVCESITSQAAAIIDRTYFIDEVESMIESIIETLVASLDRRDPITSGHSERVARISLELMNYLHNRRFGPFANYHASDDEFKELFFAAMLHDIGKIGIEGALLKKRQKLYMNELRIVELRMEILKMKLAADQDSLSEMIDNYVKRIHFINESRLLSDEDYDFLVQLRDYDTSKYGVDFLTDLEFDKLSVRVGNLSEDERNQVKEHARITHEILGNVHWSNKLKRIPEIAAGHHEKLDGSGYPHQLKNGEISLESQIIGIVDIYDALVTTDRPYKKEMSKHDTLSIIAKEAEQGKIDKDLVSEFIDMVNQADFIF